MRQLIDGFRRFHHYEFPRHRTRFRNLSAGQRPKILFVTCADSRVDPSLITQSAPGELFVLRTAGNLIPPHGGAPCGEVATLEYAINELEVEHVVVCGHTQCGAVAGMLQPDGLKRLPHLRGWLERAAPSLARLTRGGDRPAQAVAENVRVQLEHLQTYPWLRERLRKGKLRLHGWVYDFAQGEIAALDASDRYQSLLVARTLCEGRGEQPQRARQRRAAARAREARAPLTRRA